MKPTSGDRIKARVIDPAIDRKDQTREVSGTVLSVLSTMFTIDDDSGRHWFINYTDNWEQLK